MQKKFKICLLSDHHISYNPRLWKEAFYWEKCGYEVVIINMWISDKALERDYALLKGHNIRYEPYLNLIPGKISGAKRLFYRIRKRAFAEIQKKLNKGFQWAISYAPDKMIEAAIQENADVYSAHLECAFYAGRSLIKKGKKVFFDFEDWYSHDYLVPERPVGLLSKLEHFALHNGLFCLTTSEIMANALSKFYNAQRRPVVVYNGFPRSEHVIHSIPKQSTSPKLIWFSRNVGKNRGIEKLIDTLRYLHTPVELHLLGETAKEYKLEVDNQFVNSIHSVFFHDFIPHNQLTKFLSGFSLGLALEQNINANRNLTITNKILQYLQAGLKVFGTDTAGQIEVQTCFPESVRLVSLADTAEGWAEQLQQCLDPHWLNQPMDFEKFDNIFSTEAQELKLKKLAEAYFK